MKLQVFSMLTAMAVIGTLATPANATLQVIINGTNSGGTVTGGSVFTDNCAVVSATCAAVDTSSATGNLSFSFAAGTFTISGLNSTSGSPFASLTMTLNGTPSVPQTLTIAVSDNNFTNPALPITIAQNVSGLALFGSGPTANLTATGYYGSNNVNFNTGGASTTNATATLGSAAGTGVSATITGAGAYSLTEFISVNITSVGANPGMQVNANLTATPVPEPTSIALLGGVLLLTGTTLRRRFRRS
jgi:hypothetical protein